jgi:hypothetical protein
LIASHGGAMNFVNSTLMQSKQLFSEFRAKRQRVGFKDLGLEALSRGVYKFSQRSIHTIQAGA